MKQELITPLATGILLLLAISPVNAMESVYGCIIWNVTLSPYAPNTGGSSPTSPVITPNITGQAVNQTYMWDDLPINLTSIFAITAILTIIIALSYADKKGYRITIKKIKSFRRRI